MLRQVGKSVNAALGSLEASLREDLNQGVRLSSALADAKCTEAARAREKVWIMDHGSRLRHSTELFYATKSPTGTP
jgi:hypothetical protein